MAGYVVGFKTNKVHTFYQPVLVTPFSSCHTKLFVLNDNVMTTIDISMTQAMIKFLERKEFQLAYEVALLGVPDSDYLYLGNEALIATHFDIARKVALLFGHLLNFDLNNRICTI